MIAVGAGGLALADLGGSGEVRFGGVKGVPLSGPYKKVAKVPGLGKIEAACGQATHIRFRNTTDRGFRATVLRESDGQFSRATLNHGETLETTTAAVDPDTVRFQVFRAADGGKPMADITVGSSGNGNCGPRAVTVQSVSNRGSSGKVSGSGKLRFGGFKGGFTTLGPYKKVLGVPGVGKIQAQCSKGTTIRFVNTTHRTLQVTYMKGSDGSVDAAQLIHGESLITYANLPIDTVRFQVFRAADGGKPMADITVGASYPTNGACGGRAVVAQSVSNKGGSGKVAGSGAARFGGVRGLLPDTSFKKILAVPGVGKIQAKCSKATLIRFKNTSHKTLEVTAAGHGGVDFQHAELAHGQTLLALTGSIEDPSTVRFHVFRAANGGQPMADITVGSKYLPGPCGQRAVVAQSISSG